MPGSGTSSALMTLDWLWWGSAIALALVGLVLWLWAMFWDRSRGRRRCPKCWYDMSGAEPQQGQTEKGTEGRSAPSWRCPECGKLITRQRKLFKTRRRWRWAIVACAIGLGGGAGIPWWRAIERGGFWATVPTWVLIRIVDAQGWPESLVNVQGRFKIHPTASELQGRQLSSGEKAYIWARTVPHFVRFREKWPRDIPIVAHFETLSPWVNLPFFDTRLTVTCNKAPRSSASRLGVSVIFLTGPWSTQAWTDGTMELGIVPNDSDSFEFDAVLERGSRRHNLWTPAWRGSFHKRVELVDSLHEVMEPVPDPKLTGALKKRLSATLLYDTQCGWRLEVATDSKHAAGVKRLGLGAGNGATFGLLAVELDQLYPETAFGLRFEILLDGNPVGIARCWLDPLPDRRTVLPGSNSNQLQIDGEIQSLGPALVQESSWSVRVSADPEMALRDFEKTKYWDGEIEFAIPALGYSHDMLCDEEPGR